MVCPKCIFKLIPGDDVVSRKHCKVVVPPYTCSTAKLLRGKLSFVRFRSW
jgi:hypothetical protein